jgi:hypothetical protein
LTTLFGNTAVSIKKRSLLPLLTVLFLCSYGLMTLLIVEQGTTIQTQRGLIRELFSDSMQLSAMKGKAVGDQNAGDVPKHVQAQARPSQTQANTAQAGSVQTPSSQAAAAQRAHSNAAKTHKPRMQMPSRPASDLADERRALVTI